VYKIVDIFLGLWYYRIRSTDLKILWPACKEQAETLDRARVAFAFHAYNDRAWLYLGDAKVNKIISELK
jgi:hypothetical protein